MVILKKCSVKDCEMSLCFRKQWILLPDHYAEKVLEIPLSELGKGGEKDED